MAIEMAESESIKLLNGRRSIPNFDENINTTIYYFSGTGNSLKIARDLSEKLSSCELVPIAKAIKRDIIESSTKKVGFIFPLYWWGLPEIVRDFAKKIDLSNTDYIFAVITCAMSTLGGGLHQLKSIIEKKSKKLDAGFLIPMPANYIPLSDMISEKKQDIVFKKAQKKVEMISEIILTNKKKLEKEIFHFLRPISHRRFIKKVNHFDKKFNIDDKCNSCGICVKVCPVNNINLHDGQPQWLHKCQSCLACIHFCPQESIQYGTKTLKTQRYHHPEITVKDLMIKEKISGSDRI